MDESEILLALSGNKLITESKRNGVYQLGGRPISAKQQDGTWCLNVLYQNVDTLIVYSRPVTMFSKFALYE